MAKHYMHNKDKILKHTFPQTIKARITLITVIFSLVLAVFLSTISFSFFQSYARRSVVQSTEFNLQMIAGTLGQELTELDTLTKWCATNLQIYGWLSDESHSTQVSIDTYERLKDAFYSNRSSGYIRRLIVTDMKNGRLLQVGNNLSESMQVTAYNLSLLGLGKVTAPEVYRQCVYDPYATDLKSQVITIIRPIYAPGSKESVGYVYLAVSVDVVLRQLRNYRMPQDCDLYVTLPGANYRLSGAEFTDVSSLESSYSTQKEQTFNGTTMVRNVTNGKDGSYQMVTYPLGIEGVYLSQSLSSNQVSGEQRLYLFIMALICVTALGFGFFISFLLGRIINKPVVRLRKKIAAISESDFSRDGGIEWNDELGDIGRGINEMSLKIVSLLENRLADEKEKRDLEYRMLQSQINPHFLYNTLNSIKWMATIQNATGIAEMTTALSRLMKNVIKGSRTVVSLREELALLDDYFLIQQYRYGGAIVYEKNVSEDFLSVSIPCFTMQPLMENSIFHGIEPKGGSGRITLSAERFGDDAVKICVEDDGIGITGTQIEEILAGEGKPAAFGLFKEIGISSVNKRLQHCFGPDYGLSLESEIGKYTRAILLVPFRAKDVAPKVIGI